MIGSAPRKGGGIVVTNLCSGVSHAPSCISKQYAVCRIHEWSEICAKTFWSHVDFNILAGLCNVVAQSTWTVAIIPRDDVLDGLIAKDYDAYSGPLQ